MPQAGSPSCCRSHAAGSAPIVKHIYTAAKCQHLAISSLRSRICTYVCAWQYIILSIYRCMCQVMLAWLLINASFWHVKITVCMHLEILVPMYMFTASMWEPDNAAPTRMRDMCQYKVKKPPRFGKYNNRWNSRCIGSAVPPQIERHAGVALGSGAAFLFRCLAVFVSRSKRRHAMPFHPTSKDKQWHARIRNGNSLVGS